MKQKLPLVLAVAALSSLGGCASGPMAAQGDGRFVTVINDNAVVMTDTRTGRAWITGISQPTTGSKKVFADESFGQAKGR